MSNQIREEVEEFEKENGNAKFADRELLRYVVRKVDKIDGRMDNLIMTFPSHYVSKMTIRVTLGIILAMLGGLALVIFRHLEVI